MVIIVISAWHQPQETIEGRDETLVSGIPACFLGYNTKFQDITDIGLPSKCVMPLIYSLNPESLRNTLAFELFF